MQQLPTLPRSFGPLIPRTATAGDCVCLPRVATVLVEKNEPPTSDRHWAYVEPTYLLGMGRPGVFSTKSEVALRVRNYRSWRSGPR